jgi:hypothetical protein
MNFRIAPKSGNALNATFFKGNRDFKSDNFSKQICFGTEIGLQLLQSTNAGGSFLCVL